MTICTYFCQHMLDIAYLCSKSANYNSQNIWVELLYRSRPTCISMALAFF